MIASFIWEKQKKKARFKTSSFSHALSWAYVLQFVLIPTLSIKYFTSQEQDKLTSNLHQILHNANLAIPLSSHSLQTNTKHGSTRKHSLSFTMQLASRKNNNEIYNYLKNSNTKTRRPRAIKNVGGPGFQYIIDDKPISQEKFSTSAANHIPQEDYSSTSIINQFSTSTANHVPQEDYSSTSIINQFSTSANIPIHSHNKHTNPEKYTTSKNYIEHHPTTLQNSPPNAALYTETSNFPTLSDTSPFVITDRKQFISEVEDYIEPSDETKNEFSSPLAESPSTQKWHAVTVAPFIEMYIPTNRPFVQENQLHFQIKRKRKPTGRPEIVSNAPYDIIGHVTGNTLNALTSGQDDDTIDHSKQENMRHLSTTKAPTNIWYKPVINHYGAIGQIEHPEFTNELLSTTTMQPTNVRTSVLPQRKKKKSRKRVSELPVILKIWKFENGELSLLNVRQIPKWIFNNFELPNESILNLNDLPMQFRDIIVEAFDQENYKLERHSLYHWQELPSSENKWGQKECKDRRTCVNYVVWSPGRYGDKGFSGSNQAHNVGSSELYGYHDNRDQMMNEYLINSFGGGKIPNEKIFQYENEKDSWNKLVAAVNNYVTTVTFNKKPNLGYIPPPESTDYWASETIKTPAEIDNLASLLLILKNLKQKEKLNSHENHETTNNSFETLSPVDKDLYDTLFPIFEHWANNKINRQSTTEVFSHTTSVKPSRKKNKNHDKNIKGIETFLHEVAQSPSNNKVTTYQNPGTGTGGTGSGDGIDLTEIITNGLELLAAKKAAKSAKKATKKADNGNSTGGWKPGKWLKFNLDLDIREIIKKKLMTVIAVKYAPVVFLLCLLLIPYAMVKLHFWKWKRKRPPKVIHVPYPVYNHHPHDAHGDHSNNFYNGYYGQNDSPGYSMPNVEQHPSYDHLNEPVFLDNNDLGMSNYLRGYQNPGRHEEYLEELPQSSTLSYGEMMPPMAKGLGIKLGSAIKDTMTDKDNIGVLKMIMNDQRENMGSLVQAWQGLRQGISKYGNSEKKIV